MASLDTYLSYKKDDSADAVITSEKLSLEESENSGAISFGALTTALSLIASASFVWARDKWDILKKTSVILLAMSQIILLFFSKHFSVFIFISYLN